MTLYYIIAATAAGGLISVLVVRNGGLMAPNLLNYPVLVVLAGWLLGPRPTRWLVGLSLLWFGLLFFAERAGWLEQQRRLWPDQIAATLAVVDENAATGAAVGEQLRPAGRSS